jgi:VWFA-related protein
MSVYPKDAAEHAAKEPLSPGPRRNLSTFLNLLRSLTLHLATFLLATLLLTALLLAAFLLAALPLLSQQTSPITINVSAVNLLATVRDKHGNLVRNLTKDDFALEQDGKPQTITYFAKESDLPLTLGLLVDTSLSQRRVLDQERAASHSFLDRVLREDKDKAFLIHFDREVELLQDLTSSRQKLLAAIDQIHTPQYSQSSSGSGGGGGDGRGSHGHGHGGGTLLYDAIYLASDELMKKQQGRKALVILTDGVDHGSKESLADATETAQRADTLIYCILFADKEEGHGGGGFGGPRMGGGGMGGGGRGGGYPPRRTEESRPDGKKVLEQIAKTSGGHFYEVSKKETLDKIYADLDAELRNQYVLGYSPDKADATVGYHKLHLTVKQKDTQVQTRDGFYLEPK